VHAVNAATARCYQHGAAGPWQVVTLIAGSKRRSLLMAREDDEMFMTRSLNRAAFNCIRSNQSVAYATTVKDCSTFCTDTKHRAASLRQQSYLFKISVTLFIGIIVIIIDIFNVA